MNTEKCYSIDGERYWPTISDAMGDPDLWIEFPGPCEKEIWEADRVNYRASFFFNLDFDDIAQAAFDEVGEASDSWELTRDQERTLEAALSQAFDKWADENDGHPKFFGVQNPRRIRIRILDEKGNYELIQQ